MQLQIRKETADRKSEMLVIFFGNVRVLGFHNKEVLYVILLVEPMHEAVRVSCWLWSADVVHLEAATLILCT